MPLRDYAAYHVVAAKALGRPLPNGACVHHINGDCSDNRPQNLVICQDNAYHMLLHSRTAARRKWADIWDFVNEHADLLGSVGGLGI